MVDTGTARIAGRVRGYFTFPNPVNEVSARLVAGGVVVMVVLGGMGSMSGAILAAVVLTLLPEVLRPLDSLTGVDLRMILYSLALILMMLWRPQGLLGRKEAWQLPWRAWFGKFLRRPAP